MIMNRKNCFHRTLLFLALSLICGICAQSQKQESAGAHRTIGYISSPLTFEPNLGQAAARVQFLSLGSGYSLFLAPNEAVLNLERQQTSTSQEPLSKLEAPAIDTLRMKLVGANANAAVVGVDPQPGLVSYLVGNDPKKWRSGVPTFGRVNYTQVYPGVDLVFYGNQRQLEYDFVVASGADPNQIAWQIDGASPAIDKDGNLELTAANGPASFKKPVLYQMNGDSKVAVNGSFEVAGSKISFKLGDYDHAKPLIIDPVLSYATYLGGTSTDHIGRFIGPGNNSPTQAIAVDAEGSVYVTGYTYSTDFPTQYPYESAPPAKMTGVSPGQWASIFVTKFSPDGSSLIYSTYLGGNGYDYGDAIAVDSNGNAYITGTTTSPDFPITAGAYQTVCSPIPDFYHGPTIGETSSCNSFYNASAFLTKLNSTGTALVYSTFLSGEGSAEAVSIALDPAGRAYIAGNVQGYCYGAPTTPGPYPYTCFPTTPGAAVSGTVTGGGSPNYGFVAVFDPTGAQLLYSSLFGDTSGANGAGETDATGIAVDPNGYFYLAGHTQAAALPTTPGVIQPTQGPLYNPVRFYAWRGFVAKFNPVTSPGGATLAHATYIGAPALNSTSNVSDFVSGLATDNDGDVYITGYTQSPNYPVTAGAYQTSCGYGGGQSCATTYVTKLNPTLSAIEWATYLGNTTGSSSDNIGTSGPMQVDENGNVYVTGQAWFGFPQVNAVEPAAVGGSLPTFVAELDPKGQKLLFATQINTELNSIAQSTVSPAGVVVDATGNIFVAANTVGPGLLVTPGVFMPTENDFGGLCCAYGNGAVAKIAPQGAATAALTALPSPAPAGQTVTLKATITPTVQYASVPTGTVVFKDGSTDLGTVTLSGGVATFTTSTLPAGDHTMTAVYSGDSTYPWESGSASLTITPTDTAPTISPNPAAFGDQPLNTPAQIPVTVTNTGTNPLVISSVAPLISSDFSLTKNCITTLAVNASCQIAITFIPTVASAESATFTISDNAGIQIFHASGTGVSPVTSQTITFNPLSNVTYGSGPIALTATASSGLPVSYLVTGPVLRSGSSLTTTGTGVVTVTASQSGNANYSAATPVVRSFEVVKALLTVKANDVSRSYGTANRAFTYSIAGFVNNETSAVVSGTATETTTATSTSDVGSYPITFSTENLTAVNYTFNYVNGTLTVLGGVSQTITFNPPPNVTYGVSSIALTAIASSGLPVTYQVTGPATVNGSTLTNIGAGPVTVTASQAGNSNYAAATPVSRSFTVAPAILTVTANNASRAFGGANPPFTYTIAGLVNGDTTAAVSGTATETTTAITTSPGGTYPITFSTKALTAPNYAFTYVNGTLTVSAAPTVVLTTTATLTKVSGGYQATIKITNSGSGPATNVLVTTATLGVASGSPLPQSLGTLAAGGGSATFTVTFPLSAGTDGATVIEKYAGTYTGGSFTGSLRAVLP